MGTLTRGVHVHLGRRGGAFDGNKARNNLLGEKRAEGVSTFYPKATNMEPIR
jgi:hypothetical protein